MLILNFKEYKMKKIKLLAMLLALLTVASLLASCKGNGKDSESNSPPESYVDKIEYTVSFDSNGGTEIPSVTVYRGSSLNPVEPPKRDDYIFTGWTHEGKDWAFGSGGNTVRADITLYANWVRLNSIFKYEEKDGGIVLTKLINKSDYSTLILPESFEGKPITEIGPEVFKNIAIDLEDTLYNGIKTITFPSTLKSIGESAFENCSNLELHFKGSVSSLGDNAFYKCNTILELPLADGIKTIPFRAFSSSSIMKVVIPDSVTLIDENAFELSRYLVTAAIPKGVKIEDSAFRDCVSLKTVFFKGNSAEFKGLEIGGRNTPLETARVYYYSESTEVEAGKFWKFDGNGIPTIIG